jgi:polyphenol oxidase
MSGCERSGRRSSGWMGKGRGSREAGRRGSERAATLRELSVSGDIPRYEIPGWRERYGVVAGITARGSELGRGFDLGLWSNQPVGEVMSRWLAFRREMAEFDTVALGNQIHGVELMTVQRGPGWIHLQGIDGWIATTPNILLTVTIADCIPVYLVAPGTGVALLHAGWRGAAGGILPRGIERLSSTVGCSPTEVVMHCGIGICGACYEVGSEVLHGCGLPAEGSGPWHLDLRDYLVSQAVALGLTRITASPWCSAHDRPAFYSHRASSGTDGRMAGYIGMAEKRGSGEAGEAGKQER